MFRIIGAVLAAICAAAFSGCESRDSVSGSPAAAAGFVQTEETAETENTVESAVPEILSGVWFNAENMEEKWTFGAGGILSVGNEEHTYSLRRSLLWGDILEMTVSPTSSALMGTRSSTFMNEAVRRHSLFIPRIMTGMFSILETSA